MLPEACYIFMSIVILITYIIVLLYRLRIYIIVIGVNGGLPPGLAAHLVSLPRPVGVGRDADPCSCPERENFLVAAGAVVRGGLCYLVGRACQKFTGRGDQGPWRAKPFPMALFWPWRLCSIFWGEKAWQDRVRRTIAFSSQLSANINGGRRRPKCRVGKAHHTFFKNSRGGCSPSLPLRSLRLGVTYCHFSVCLQRNGR